MSHGPQNQAPAIDDPPISTSSDDSGDDEPRGEDGASNSVHSSQKTWIDRFTAKRKAVLDAFFNTLDGLVYVELVAIYYLDISTTLLLLRLLTHITPLPTTLSILPPRLRPSPSNASIFPILFVGLVCILYHLFFSLPQAGEATRFDLNGHVLVDFIGQRALRSWPGRIRLISMDLTIVFLQTLACGTFAQGEKSSIGVPKDVASGTPDEEVVMPTDMTQRSSSRGPGISSGESAEGIEMQPLMHRSSGLTDDQETLASSQVTDSPQGFRRARRSTRSTAAAGNEQVTRDLVINATSESSAREGLEALYSGQSILVDIYLWSMLRDQYYERRNRVLAGQV